MLEPKRIMTCSYESIFRQLDRCPPPWYGQNNFSSSKNRNLSEISKEISLLFGDRRNGKQEFEPSCGAFSNVLPKKFLRVKTIYCPLDLLPSNRVAKASGGAERFETGPTEINNYQLVTNMVIMSRKYYNPGQIS